MAAAASERPLAPVADFSELMVLCYHAVSATWPSPAAISPSGLDRQLRYLLKRGYRPMTLAAALAAGAPTKALVVTFDDAYSSILDAGLPVLERLEVPATVFVPTDSADEAGSMRWSELAQWVGGEHEQELRCMSWEEICKLSERGWEIGSHTCSHPHLTELGEGEMAPELERSRAVCEERTQKPCVSLAYPFGSYDDQVLSAVAAAGYRAAVTLDERLLEPLRGRGPLTIPREAIYRETGQPVFAAKTSRLVRRVRVSRAYAALA
jgi:peptidoglycan/xylan/chitin deacetylase (PgdA/CDA1 family)